MRDKNNQECNRLFNMGELFNKEWDELTAEEDNSKAVLIVIENAEAPEINRTHCQVARVGTQVEP